MSHKNARVGNDCLEQFCAGRWRQVTAHGRHLRRHLAGVSGVHPVVAGGRNKSNLSRTLRKMSRYGLVELTEGQRGAFVARIPYDRVSLDISLTSRSRSA